MTKNQTAENSNVAFYDSIVLQMINNKALTAGLIDEKTKLNIEHQIQRKAPVILVK